MIINYFSQFLRKRVLNKPIWVRKLIILTIDISLIFISILLTKYLIYGSFDLNSIQQIYNKIFLILFFA